METKIRGIVEKIIDDQVSDDGLAKLESMLELFSPLIKSKEDAMFGCIIGSTSIHFVLQIVTEYQRKPTNAESQEMFEILQRRAQEIKSKISVVTMR